MRMGSKWVWSRRANRFEREGEGESMLKEVISLPGVFPVVDREA